MKITPIATLGQDDRGYTAEYYHDRMGQQLLVFRKAGTVSGNHYHKGISLSKAPEILIVVHGTCLVKWREIKETEIQSAVVTGPCKIEIAPYIWHELTMETDCCLLELNSLAEHVADTFYIGK